MLWYQTTLIVIGSVLLLLVILLIVISFVVVGQIVHPHRYSRSEQTAYNHKMGWDKGCEALARNPIEFKMDDGYLIHGDYNLVPLPRGYVILAHGHGTSREGALRYSLLFEELGFSTIIYDERSHGDNVHKQVTMGYIESQDLASIIEQAYKKFGYDIILGLQGVSMGAATVLLSTQYSQKSRFIVSDCAFASFKDVLCHLLKKMHLPSGLLLPLVNFELKAFHGFSLKDVSPINVIGNNQIPTLFIHGDKDDFVPVKAVDELYEKAACKKEKVVFMGAEHASSITIDREKYKDAVDTFLKGVGI